MSSISTTVDAGWFDMVAISALFDTSQHIAAQLENRFQRKHAELYVTQADLAEIDTIDRRWGQI